jgi:hypothetical protein
MNRWHLLGLEFQKFLCKNSSYVKSVCESNFTVYCKLATALCSMNFDVLIKKHAKSRKPTLQIRRRPQKLRPKTIKKTRFLIFIWDICNCLYYTGHLIRFNRFHVSVTDYTAVNYKGTARISKAF